MYELEIARILKAVYNTNGYLDKKAILFANKYLPSLKTVLHFIYNPYIKTGISEAKFNKAMKIVSSITEGIDTTEIIHYLRGHQTGTDNDVLMVARYLYYTTQLTQHTGEDWVFEMAKAVVTQNLKIGLDVKSLNAIFGSDFIPRVGCMLGVDHKKATIQWPAIVTEKLDGIRRILIKENGSCRFFSRSGIEDDGLLELAAEAAHLPDNCMYDGELLACGQFRNSIALRQATNSIANSKGVKTGLDYYIFDMVPLEQFYAGTSKHTALDRKLRLGATFKHNSIANLGYDVNKVWEYSQAFGLHDVVFKRIKFVPILGMVSSMDEVASIVATIWNTGGEGVMLNIATGLYEIKRSKTLLKVKNTETHCLQVVDMVEGTGKFEGMLGALIVIYDGYKLGVGSGFDEFTRRKIWNEPQQYIGEFIEVETFGESRNAAGERSLNCPIFKQFIEEDKSNDL